MTPEEVAQQVQDNRAAQMQALLDKAKALKQTPKPKKKDSKK